MDGLGSSRLPDMIGNKNERNRCCVVFGSLFLGWAKPTARRRTDDYGDPFKTWGDAAKDDGSRRAEETKILMTDEGGGRSMEAFIVDSGASVHATGNPALLSWYETLLHTERFILGASGHHLRVSGSGSVRTDRIILNDVLFVPGLEKNVVSVSKLAELDYGVDFGKTGCCITDDHTGALVGQGSRVAGLYQLDYLKIPLDRGTSITPAC